MSAGSILTRAIWAIGLLGGGALLFWLLKRFILARARGNEMRLPSYQVGRPAVLYFSTPECVTCRTFQKPALQRLEDRYRAELQVIEVDAHEQPGLADQWGVMSVPTTFILSSDGKAQQVNNGAAGVDKLVKQLRTVLEDNAVGANSQR